MLARRNQYQALADFLHKLAETATPKQERYSQKEIRFVPTIRISYLRGLANDYGNKARTLDNIIQNLNWTTDIEEEV